MRKQVYEVDDLGYIKEIYVAEIIDDEIVDEDKKHLIFIDPPQGLFRAKWDGQEWIEGKSQAEFEEEEFLNSLTPSAEEIANAEYEIKTLNILMEVELI